MENNKTFLVKTIISYNNFSEVGYKTFRVESESLESAKEKAFNECSRRFPSAKVELVKT